MYKPILNLANKIEEKKSVKLEPVFNVNTAIVHIIYYCT